MKNEKDKNFEEDDIRDILEYHPNWFIKWGISIIAVIILALLIGTKFIDNPEVINSTYTVLINQRAGDTTLKPDSKYDTASCIIPINLYDREKLKKGKEYVLIFDYDKPQTTTEKTCLLDSVYFSPGKNIFLIHMSFLINGGISGSSVFKNDITNGSVKIVVEKKSLLERFFGKYGEFNNILK